VKHRNRALRFFTVAAVLLGCGDPLKDGQRIEELRPLGARVVSASNHATPASGEDADLSFLFAGPEGPVTVEVAYEVCLGVPTARGVATCAEEPWASGRVTVSDDSPAVSFNVPAQVAPSSRIAVRAVACETGSPVLTEDPLDWACDDDSTPATVSFEALTSGEEENENPDLSLAEVWIGEQSVPLGVVGVAPLCAPDDPALSAGTTQTLRVVIPDAAREDLEEDLRETLQLSHFSTAGSLERQFSILDGGETPEAELDWELPEGAGPVVHYVVVRDGRGGLAWLTFSVCVR
jgi:hypothetical protein